MVTFTAISDIHCFPLRQILKGYSSDVLLICGDLSFRGTPKELNAFEKDLKAVRGDFRDIIWIAGNHDIGLEDWPQLGPEIADRTNTHYLCDSFVKVQGITIFGSPYTPEFGDWAFAYKRPTSRWYQKPPSDILVTHGPPYGILDECRDGHVGCYDLKHSILKMNPKPKVVCFGHIHEGAGSVEIDGVKFHNCSVVNGHYDQVHKPITFEVAANV